MNPNLKSCPACHRAIAKEVAACPYCGNSSTLPKKIALGIGVVLLLLVILVFTDVL